MEEKTVEPGSQEYFRHLSELRKHLKNKSKNDLIRIVTAMVIDKLEAKKAKESE